MSFNISFVIPTYNCAKVLRASLAAIREQDYPQDKVEIIVVDGDSTDDTRTVATEFGALVLDNPEVAHPQGRPIGIRVAKGDLIVCLDSDNILPERDWLKKMATPFLDQDVVAAEPLEYSAGPEENPVTRYCSLIGGDDPFVVYLGYNERYSWLTGKWTGVPVREEDVGGWLKVAFQDAANLPSLGANGFVVRKSVLQKVQFDPFYHMDVSHRIVAEVGGSWAKVKTGVIHRHGDTVVRFIEKKRRRVERRMDHDVTMHYRYPVTAMKMLPIVLRGLLVLPVFFDAIRGWVRKRDSAWFYHPVIFFGVFAIYSSTVLRRLFFRAKGREYEKV